MTRRNIKKPEDVAEMVVNVLCAYDGEKAPGDIEETRQRTAEFMYEFILIMSTRLAQAANKEPVD